MTGVKLEARSLVFDYGTRRVLDGVELALGDGEMAALLGPNGAGKSTLMRCVSGILKPSSGSIMLDGQPLAEYDRPSLARRIAVVPGEVVTAFPIPVEELVALGRVPHEHPFLGPRPADQAAIGAAIERVGIGHLRGRDVRELSLGERQMVVLAMAVAQGARLLLLDEPTVHLDLRHQVAVMELLRDLSRDGVAVLAVMHDISLASHFFPRLIFLADGRVAADGPPATVLTGTLIEQIYGVDPALVPVALR